VGNLVGAGETVHDGRALRLGHPERLDAQRIVPDRGDGRLGRGHHILHRRASELLIGVGDAGDAELAAADELDAEHEPAADERHDDRDEQQHDRDAEPDAAVADEVDRPLAGVEVVSELSESCHQL
jgi:hypothetical protein